MKCHPFLYRLGITGYLMMGLPVSYLETRKLAIHIQHELQDESPESKALTYYIGTPVFVLGTFIHPFLYTTYAFRGEFHQLYRIPTFFDEDYQQFCKIRDV